MREIHSTDEETLVFKKNGKHVGSVNLIYGNTGFDVISDHTESDDIYSLLEGAESLANALEDE